MSKRQKFFLSHLLISVFAALLVMSFVFFVWYPSPLAKAVGVTHIFLMLLIIDVILGPLLGVLVFKEGKKTLKFDLTVIILIQISALCYGVYSIAQARPVWIAFNADKFELVRNNEMQTNADTAVEHEFSRPSLLYPQFVGVKQAENAEQRQVEQMSSLLNGTSLAQFPERYTPLKRLSHDLRQEARNISELYEVNSKLEVEKILKENPHATAWLPLETYALPLVVLIDKDKAEIVKIVDLRYSK